MPDASHYDISDAYFYFPDCRRSNTNNTSIGTKYYLPAIYQECDDIGFPAARVTITSDYLARRDYLRHRSFSPISRQRTRQRQRCVLRPRKPRDDYYAARLSL